MPNFRLIDQPQTEIEPLGIGHLESHTAWLVGYKGGILSHTVWLAGHKELIAFTIISNRKQRRFGLLEKNISFLL